MILAAGLGTRLQPLTFYLPKPLFPVLNRSLLHRLLDQLEDAGFRKIVINCFHLAHLVLEMVGSYKGRAEIITLVEPSLLGTGGALRNALPHISKNEPLLVINGDVVTDLDPAHVVNMHQHHGAKASLVVHKREPWNNIAVMDEKVSGFNYSGLDAMAFTGISVLEPEFIRTIPENCPSSLVDAFKVVIDKGDSLQALRADKIAGHYIWEDIGSPGGYLSAHKVLFAGENKRCLVGRGTELPGDLMWKDWVSIGPRVSLGSDITLCRSVIWEGSNVPSGAVLEDCVFSPYGNIIP
ncbi:MAG: NDP-sugar synthase [Deltaproteobacteria bacterium]|nr:NDP-sugar synthase [Deltaproteobacteria bacterium]MBW1937768.1 NDP-sugar synthase [Deltaproteobacteria bacterium]MBW2349791.1 NDP-sugar synthase [Deltaproteobacteria bacterium]